MLRRSSQPGPRAPAKRGIRDSAAGLGVAAGVGEACAQSAQGEALGGSVGTLAGDRMQVFANRREGIERGSSTPEAGVSAPWLLWRWSRSEASACGDRWVRSGASLRIAAASAPAHAGRAEVRRAGSTGRRRRLLTQPMRASRDDRHRSDRGANRDARMRQDREPDERSPTVMSLPTSISADAGCGRFRNAWLNGTPARRRRGRSTNRLHQADSWRGGRTTPSRAASGHGRRHDRIRWRLDSPIVAGELRERLLGHSVGTTVVRACVRRTVAPA